MENACFKRKIPQFEETIYTEQRAKKVVSDSPGLVDFAIGREFVTGPTGK